MKLNKAELKCGLVGRDIPCAPPEWNDYVLIHADGAQGTDAPYHS